MNEENEWDQMLETDVVEGPVEKVAHSEIVEAMQKMKSGKTTGPSEISAMKIVERVLERRIQTLVSLNKMQFGFLPGKGTVDAIFIMRRMQEEYQQEDKKLHMCFVDMEKAFDRVPRKVMDWAMRKKGLSKVMVGAVMSLYDGAKVRVRVGSAYSKEFEVKVGVH